MHISLLFLLFIYIASTDAQECSDTSVLEKNLIVQGLVNVRSIDSSIQVNLKYSTEDNFINEDVYGELCNCYLQKEAAEKLIKAQQLLRKLKPGYSLLLLDCARVRSVQYKMWELVKGTDKQKYVANPTYGSIHNYGAAVDVTIIDTNGKELDMGTVFDFFGDLAQPRYESKFLKVGKLTEKQIKNRKLLRKVMAEAGFQYIQTEWWHFNALPKAEVRKRYSIIE